MTHRVPWKSLILTAGCGIAPLKSRARVEVTGWAPVYPLKTDDRFKTVDVPAGCGHVAWRGSTKCARLTIDAMAVHPSLPARTLVGNVTS